MLLNIPVFTQRLVEAGPSDDEALGGPGLKQSPLTPH